MTRRACAAAVAWLLLASLPAAAVAAGGPGETTMRFAFGAHGGYRVDVFATRTTMLLRVDAREGAGRSEASTAYVTRAQLDGDHLRADFGELGRVSMRFVPSGASPSTRCANSRRLSTRHGAFVGSLEFRGEGDYLDANVRRARGAVDTVVPGSVCHTTSALGEGRPRSKPKHKQISLYAGFRRGLDAVYFRAYRIPGRAFYEVIDESGGEGVAVYRYAYVEASPLSFATDSALSFAGVSPPYPFSGTGSIQRNPDGSRVWAGSLAASFPGDPSVPLTGPLFKTQLLREW